MIAKGLFRQKEGSLFTRRTGQRRSWPEPVQKPDKHRFGAVAEGAAELRTAGMNGLSVGLQCETKRRIRRAAGMRQSEEGARWTVGLIFCT